MKEEPTEIRSKNEIVSDLEKLSHEDGFIYTLSHILMRDLFLDPAEAVDIDWNNHLSFQEIAFLCGLMVKQKISESFPTNFDVLAEQMEKTYKLFEELHWAYNQPILEKIMKASEEHAKDQNSEEVEKVFQDAQSMTEPIFYSDSGAYDFQYWNFVQKRYQRDDGWLEAKYGFTSEQMAKFAEQPKRISEVKSKILELSEPSQESYAKMLDVFCFSKSDLSKIFGEDVATNFLSVFSLTPGEVNKLLKIPGEYNQVNSHPIIKLDEERFFIPISFLLSQSVYESPFYWMAADESYKNESYKNRGGATEEVAFNLLSDVFGEDKVYQGVTIEGKKGQRITEIDVLVILGDKTLILQAKSKKLTALSRSGDQAQLKFDFENAIQDAYDQAKLSRNEILNGVTLFDSEGKEIKFDCKINDAYIICLTSDYYPAVMHQTDTYLKKEAADPAPLSINIFDLDILCFYLTDPHDFFYYLRQRSRLSSYYKASSEMALLSFHLNQGLFRDQRYDHVGIADSFAQLIDGNFPALRGDVPKTKATEQLHHKWKNPEFTKLIDDLKKDIPQFTDAVFLLCDLVGDGADDLIKQINSIKKRTLSDGLGHDAALIYNKGEFGITLICVPVGSTITQLEKRLSFISQARKYKTKANVWLGIGVFADSSRIVDVAVFNNDTWVENEKLDQISKLLAIKKAKWVNGKKIGRNDLCPCGKGKKYKKCCGY